MSKPKKLNKAQEEEAQKAFKRSDIFKGIARRFQKFHRIKIDTHIEKITKMGKRLEKGFEFVPRSAREFERELKRVRFQHDVREKHYNFIPSIGSFAAMATKGEGYREIGSPSLHCAVETNLCSVHLDNIGFRCENSGPNAGPHVVDELLWQDLIIPLLGEVLPTAVTDVLHRFHPVVPNLQQFKPFSAVGVEFDLVSGRSPDLQQQVRLTIDLTHSCSDVACGMWRKLDGTTVKSDNKAMLMLKVNGW